MAEDEEIERDDQEQPETPQAPADEGEGDPTEAQPEKSALAAVMFPYRLFTRSALARESTAAVRFPMLDSLTADRVMAVSFV